MHLCVHIVFFIPVSGLKVFYMILGGGGEVFFNFYLCRVEISCLSLKTRLGNKISNSGSQHS